MSVMWDHIEHTHSSQCTTASHGRFTIGLDCSRSRPTSVALSALGETFFMVSRVMSTNLYCCVMYVGPRTNGSLYNYTVTISRRGRRARSSSTVCLATKSYFIDVQRIFRNPDCAMFPYTMWNSCADADKKLSCEVQIR
jgi:hypothetical protein